MKICHDVDLAIVSACLARETRAIHKRIGHLVYLEVMGNGPNSAQIQFTLAHPGTEKETYIVTAYPSFEPQVFAGMAALLAAAYYAKGDIEISYMDVPNASPLCTRVSLTPTPSAT